MLPAVMPKKSAGAPSRAVDRRFQAARAPAALLRYRNMNSIGGRSHGSTNFASACHTTGRRRQAVTIYANACARRFMVRPSSSAASKPPARYWRRCGARSRRARRSARVRQRLRQLQSHRIAAGKPVRHASAAFGAFSTVLATRLLSATPGPVERHRVDSRRPENASAYYSLAASPFRACSYIRIPSFE